MKIDWVGGSQSHHTAQVSSDTLPTSAAGSKRKATSRNPTVLIRSIQTATYASTPRSSRRSGSRNPTVAQGISDRGDSSIGRAAPWYGSQSHHPDQVTSETLEWIQLSKSERGADAPRLSVAPFRALGFFSYPRSGACASYILPPLQGDWWMADCVPGLAPRTGRMPSGLDGAGAVRARGGILLPRSLAGCFK